MERLKLILEHEEWLQTEASDRAEFNLPRRLVPHQRPANESARVAMQDLTMLLFTVVFFGLAFLYVKACQKLR